MTLCRKSVQLQKTMPMQATMGTSPSSAVNETKMWLGHFNRRKITVKQLTREVLVELIDKIYVYPDQKLDIYFKFASMENSADRILEKDRVI